MGDAAENIDDGPDSPSTRSNAGPVSRDEYVQAAADTVACLVDLGHAASWNDQPDGSIALVIATESQGEPPTPEQNRAVDECSAEHLNEIQSAYLSTIRPSEDEAAAIIVACMADLGLVDASSSMEEVDEVSRQELGGELDDEINACYVAPYEGG